MPSGPGRSRRSRYVGAITSFLALTPLPRSIEQLDGTLRWSAPLRIRVSGSTRTLSDSPITRDSIDRHAGTIAESLGWSLQYADASGDEHATLRCHVDEGAAPGYRLRTTGTAVELEGHSAEAIQWGLIALHQLIEPARTSTTSMGRSVELPRVVIEDAPQFSWRGVHLDVARHFFDVATVKRFIELIVLHRLNVLHLHLSDDQGFRLEVPEWPDLTAVSSRRASSPLGHESDGLDDEVAHGGYFSATDIGELVEFARDRFVTIVPEIDMPGHVQAILAAYPEFSNVEGPLPVWNRWGISEHVLNLEEPTLAFAEGLIDYVGQLFPGPYIHIGGDECPTREWSSSPAAKQRMLDLGIESERSVQQYFTNRLATRVTDQPLVDAGPTGEIVRRAIAWDEVLDGDVPTTTIIAAWRHSSKGAEAARRGHDVVMAPMQFTYFDWPQSDDDREPVALTRPPYPTTLEKAYRFRPLPPGLEARYHHRILGAQAQLWSEYIATSSHLDYMAFPRLVAFAETVWNSRFDDYESFLERLTAHLERLDAFGVNFRPLDAT